MAVDDQKDQRRHQTDELGQQRHLVARWAGSITSAMADPHPEPISARRAAPLRNTQRMDIPRAPRAGLAGGRDRRLKASARNGSGPNSAWKQEQADHERQADPKKTGTLGRLSRAAPSGRPVRRKTRKTSGVAGATRRRPAWANVPGRCAGQRTILVHADEHCSVKETRVCIIQGKKKTRAAAIASIPGMKVRVIRRWRWPTGRC